MIYLYVKTHNKTGFKYLGKTTKDPYLYQGSGKHWKRHIQKHGNDVRTEILLATLDKEELKETGIFFSALWNVVESKDWANLIPESGDGGDTTHSGYVRTDEHNKKISTTLNDEKVNSKLRSNNWARRNPEEHRNHAKKAAEISNHNRTPETLEKISLSMKKYLSSIDKHPNSGKIRTMVKCPYCTIQGASNTMKRWHFDNCKYKQ